MDSCFRLKDFRRLRLLGEGGFGKVVLCRHETKNGALQVALKQIIPKSTGELMSVMREISVHKEMNHPHILRFLGEFEENNKLYVILEFASEGNLRAKLDASGYRHFSEPTSAKILVGVMRAIQYCHANNVIHRDIKPENILIDHRSTIKISDFGLCTTSIISKTFCGTLGYMAPEMWFAPHCKQVDIWAIGVLFYELLTGDVPFRQTRKDCGLPAYKSNYSVLNDEVQVSKDAKNIVNSLLKKDPNERSSLEFLLGHGFFSQHGVN